jgi:hypothetical protein
VTSTIKLTLGSGEMDRGLNALVQQLQDRRQVLSGQYGELLMI